ncbi:hypothetical protein ACFX2I_033182 [Malus domestica]
MYISQHQNKASAMAVIQSRVDQLEMACQNKMNAQYSQSLTDMTWGSQIRSYVLQEDVEGFILSYLSACLDKDEDDNGESDLHNFAKAEPVPHVQTLNL